MNFRLNLNGMRMIMKKLPILLTLLLFIMAGCNMPERFAQSSAPDINTVATNVALTIEALATPITPSPVASPTTGKPTSTAMAASTSTATTTITPTYSSPQLMFDNNVNCRKGPGTSFPIVILIKEGQTVDVVGQMEKYWIVRAPDTNEDCWLPVEFATPVGSVWTVPTVSASNAPTEVPPIAPVWMKWNYYCSWSDAGQTITMEMEWSDKNRDETGFRVLRNGETIVELPADSTAYTDTVLVEGGSTYRYAVEVYRGVNSSKSSVIDTSCQ